MLQAFLIYGIKREREREGEKKMEKEKKMYLKV